MTQWIPFKDLNVAQALKLLSLNEDVLKLDEVIDFDDLFIGMTNHDCLVREESGFIHVGWASECKANGWQRCKYSDWMEDK